jgi:tRNA-Thr(GGU) m(6)t(6)A37 methyltransferase TsaA
MPIQGRFKKGTRGTIRLFPGYEAGLKDIQGFSHLILIYSFNRSKEEKLVGKPFLEDKEHGIFAIRSPHRPNHLGFSIVKLEKVRGSTVIFSDVDILDGTPLLDIKPYVSHFDSRKRVRNGWTKKYFLGHKIPDRACIV